jgi:hypothetical protein
MKEQSAGCSFSFTKLDESAKETAAAQEKQKSPAPPMCVSV